VCGHSYDIVTVGGGLGGSSLAKAMAERGARVLVLERDKQFRDRVRGETLAPWGGAEAEQLGIYGSLLDSCGFEKRWALGPGPRDLVATTPQNLPSMTFYHPQMQEAMLSAAAEAGAEVCRGVTVRSVNRGSPVMVQFETDLGTREVSARLVVGADGRGSAVRKWANFEVKQDRERLLAAGVLLGDLQGIPDESFYFVLNPAIAEGSLVLAHGSGLARAYVAYRVDADFRLQGGEALGRFIKESVRCGIPADIYANAKLAGPLATFSGADRWVEHPYSNGIALIGDAASSSDPSWGQGLSLTLRDVRVLRDQLLSDNDWDSAGHAYAREHDRYYGRIHTVEDWLTIFFYSKGADADALRQRAFPLIAEDIRRVPDHLNSGPEQPVDESVRMRFFGQD
jgi:menaquinone-9 beta-reductase